MVPTTLSYRLAWAPIQRFARRTHFRYAMGLGIFSQHRAYNLRRTRADITRDFCSSDCRLFLVGVAATAVERAAM